MSEFELVVLGGGTGNLVASAASEEGMDVALVERGPLGGTCLNRACNPTKKLIHRAEIAETVHSAADSGVDALVQGVDYDRIVSEVNTTIHEAAEQKAERARDTEHLTLYQCEGQFVNERTVEVDTGERLTAETVVLAGGSRPRIPDPIDGTDETDFLTSDDAVSLEERPDRLLIVGGGYIAVEMSYFFAQMGADVVIIGYSDKLVNDEDAEIAEHVTNVYQDRHELHLGYSVNEIAETDSGTEITAEDNNGEELTVRGDRLLIATGRQPNSDSWNVEAGNIETTEEGFVETDEYLETSVDDVYAIGDIAGNHMFKHAGDTEAKYVVDNVVYGTEKSVEYPGMAHAIFGSPQVASLGKTESDLEDDTEYEIGRFDYNDTALGEAMNHEGGFAKVIVSPDGDVLGCHIVGPDASTLIHEVNTAVVAGGDAETIAETIHIHPALSEVVQGAFRDVVDVAPSGI
jgi:dihydrolipoamide dehydrogenase